MKTVKLRAENSIDLFCKPKPKHIPISVRFWRMLEENKAASSIVRSSTALKSAVFLSIDE
jgi:hypothetical protein